MQYQNKVRIIAGKWRRRQITFNRCDDLRPSGDRLRETVFNWLTPYLHAAYCLDAFAGSGVLGFEALSRGANHVVMIEQARTAIADLNKNCAKLAAHDQVTIINATIPAVVSALTKPFDIVFLDPPFEQDLLVPSCQWLAQQQLIKTGSLVYLEAEKTWQPTAIPCHWQQVKMSTVGKVNIYLYKVTVNNDAEKMV